MAKLARYHEGTIQSRNTVDQMLDLTRIDDSTDSPPPFVCSPTSPLVDEELARLSLLESSAKDKQKSSRSWRIAFGKRVKDEAAGLDASPRPSATTSSSASSASRSSSERTKSGGSVASMSTLTTAPDVRGENMPSPTCDASMKPCQARSWGSAASARTAMGKSSPERKPRSPSLQVHETSNSPDLMNAHRRSGSMTDTILGVTSGKNATSLKRPVAEIDMVSGTYQGYWRSNYATSIPAAAAICAAVILTTAVRSGGIKDLRDTHVLLESAAVLRDRLDQAATTAEMLQGLQNSTLATIVFAMRKSLADAQIPPIPTRIALAMYEKVDGIEDGQVSKMLLAWPHVAKALKRIPEKSLVPLMFLVFVGQRLQARGITINGKPAIISLLQNIWPQVEQQNSSSRELLSIMFLDRFEDMPDELPVAIEAIRYSFESGGRGDLLSLIAMNRQHFEKSGRN